MHPWDRLHRAAIGDHLNEPRGLEKALFAREKPAPEPRTVASKVVASLSLRGSKVKKASHLANPKPNAPLLKRIIRHPYALEGTASRTRVRLREEVPWKDLVHDERPVMADILAELRTDVTNGNPVADIMAMRDLNRPRPSTEGWLGDLSGNSSEGES